MKHWLTPEQSDWSWQRLVLLVAGVWALVLPARGWLGRAVFVGAVRQVRLAEALARRLLICRAAELGVAAVRRGPAPCGAARVRAGLGARRVCLALVDRLDLAGPCAAPGAGAGMAFEAPGWVSTAHLARRVAGLQALIAEPERYARLMARRLIGSTRAGRTSPLRPGAPPGLPADLHDLDGSALRLAHSGALAVLNAPP